MRSRANAKINFQRRHFEFIARMIAQLPTNNNVRNYVATQFAHDLRYTNPNFQEDKFIAWANGDERSESEKNAELRAIRKAEKERAKVTREANKPVFSLAELEKAETVVERLRRQIVNTE